MDGNQGPEVVPAGHGDAGFGRAAGDAAAIPGPPDLAVAGRLAAGPLAGFPPTDSAGIIDRIRELEDWKSAASAEQARLAVAFDLLQRREQAPPESRPRSSAPGSARRSPWPGANPPPGAAGSSAWPKPSSPRCRTRSPPCKPGS